MIKITLIILLFFVIGCSPQIKSIPERPNNLRQYTNGEYCLGTCCNSEIFPYKVTVNIYNPTYGKLYENDSLIFFDSAKEIPEMLGPPEDVVKFPIYFKVEINKPIEYHSVTGGDAVARVWREEICGGRDNLPLMLDSNFDANFNRPKH